MSLDEFDAIPERVRSKGPIETLNGFGIVLHFAASGGERFEKAGEINDEKCRMRLLGGAKIRLDAKV